MVRVTVAGRVGIETGEGSTEGASLGGLSRAAFAYLVCGRHRPVPRDELAEVLWGEDLPSWEQLLRGLSSKIRAAATQAGQDGPTFLTSRFGALQVQLPPGAVVDIEQAEADVQAAALALTAGETGTARSRASAAADVAARQFLPGAKGHLGRETAGRAPRAPSAGAGDRGPRGEHGGPVGRRRHGSRRGDNPRAVPGVGVPRSHGGPRRRRQPG